MIRLFEHLSTFLNFLVNRSKIVKREVLNTTLERECHFCGSLTINKAQICSPCLTDSDQNIQSCAQCALPLNYSTPDKRNLCGECIATSPYFDHTVAPMLFSFPVDDCIKRFKYEGARYYGKAFAELLIKEILSQNFLKNEQTAGTACEFPELLLPVPQDPGRKRPFHHTDYLSRHIARQLGIKSNSKWLAKTISTPNQANLSKKQRIQNLKNAYAFDAAAISSLPNSVAIIDDVMTTGSTANSIAKLMKSLGVIRVEIWVLARTDKPTQS